MARAPSSDQRQPARFMRCWTRCLAEASTAPEPIGKCWSRKVAYCMRSELPLNCHLLAAGLDEAGMADFGGAV